MVPAMKWTIPFILATLAAFLEDSFLHLSGNHSWVIWIAVALISLVFTFLWEVGEWDGQYQGENYAFSGAKTVLKLLVFAAVSLSLVGSLITSCQDSERSSGEKFSLFSEQVLQIVVPGGEIKAVSYQPFRVDQVGTDVKVRSAEKVIGDRVMEVAVLPATPGEWKLVGDTVDVSISSGDVVIRVVSPWYSKILPVIFWLVVFVGGASVTWDLFFPEKKGG